MKNPGFAPDLRKKLGSPSGETIESLRLLRAFVKLSPRQRSEVVELVERLAPVPGGKRRRFNNRG
jgi:hypothetical protein